MIRYILNYLYLKIKWHKKLIFSFSTKIARSSFFEGANKVCKKTSFNGTMGYGSYIGANSSISGRIGRFTSIADRCNVIVGNHPYKQPFVTTSPMFFSIRKQNGHTFANRQLFNEAKFAEQGYMIVIGSDCWIGHGVNFIGGIKRGDSAMVMANAVVTKDVPPYAIVGGVPATIKGYRFDDETIKFLLEKQWWNNSIEWIASHWELMTDIEKLKKYYKVKI